MSTNNPSNGSVVLEIDRRILKKSFTFQFVSACMVLGCLVSLPLLQASMAPMNVSDDYKE